MHREWSSPYAPSRHDPIAPYYPARYQHRLRWGLYEYVCSAMFISFSLALIAGITLLVLQLIGFDSLTQVYGFNRLIEHFEIGPPPTI